LNGVIKWFFKWLLRIGLFLAAVVVLLLIFKDSILCSLAERRIREETGMPVKIGKFSGSFFSPNVTFKDLQLYNTPEFGGGRWLKASELHMELDPVAAAQGKLRIKVLRLNIAELVVIRNKAGETNVIKMLAGTGGGHNPRAGSKKQTDTLKFDGIDEFTLSFANAKFMDLKDPRRSRNLPDFESTTFYNLRSEGDFLGMLVLMEFKTGGGLFGVTPDAVTKAILEEKLKPSP
jgi:uncharacterized protein involved in outer membrane biogenesis